MRLKQIILNLAANSSKFVEKGFIKLRAEVVTEHYQQPKRQQQKQQQRQSSKRKLDDGATTTSTTPMLQQNVYLHVEDSGPGIPAHKRDRLFARFQESLDSLNQGTGIGLCVCKNLSELMGADIYLDQEFESGFMNCPGTRFTLRLNQAPMGSGSGVGQDGTNGYSNGEIVGFHDDDDNNDGYHGTGTTSALSNGHKQQQQQEELPENLSVLFVDDDTMIRKLFSRSLKRVAPTWTIQEASNGETALRMVEKETFDLIFLDQYMASIEKQLLGTETVRLLRNNSDVDNTIICGLSANDQEEQFLDAGANGFMLKPFPCKKEALTRELLKLLQARRAMTTTSEASVLGGSGGPVMKEQCHAADDSSLSGSEIA
uniref:Response regulatory domain-containing protein n=1 Tax=Grammatophora oceanica TaxID=210454 RepID=A0A7S1YGL3_9STRA|mmetsp:Transcript_48042/g.71596  ORF Transcript_48042/g.71596 Transcript_48042/m.71596 type:complete len:372 (+) Transcript_48042:3-1118(+)